MKFIGWVFAVIFAVMFAYNSLKEESQELDYVMDSMSFLVSWSSDQNYPIACNQESIDNDEENHVSVIQIQSLIDKGLMACALDGRVGVPLGIGRALTETAYIPVRAAIPYEIAKTALQGDKPKRCSDYIKPLLAACPSLLKPYFERVEFINHG